MQRRTKVTIIAMVASFGWSGAALADWSFTNWGDDLAILSRKSAGDITPFPGRSGQSVFGEKLVAKGHATVADIPMDAEFYFRNPRSALTMVKLLPVDRATCARLETALTALHGTPVETRAVTIFEGFVMNRRVWQDRPGNMVILFADFPSLRGAEGPRDCHVIYQPYGNGKPGDR